MVKAINDMLVRGAPLLGVAASYGMYLAALEAPRDKRFHAFLDSAAQSLRLSRPTAVNLAWALEEQRKVTRQFDSLEKTITAMRQKANEIADNDISICKSIGSHGLRIIKRLSEEKKGRPINILTHCNAGWLCAVDWGTATAPIYRAADKKIPIHVYVDETRPRNQGAALTAWELSEQGISHALVTDNAGGHLMQKRKVDLVIVGTDRVARNGDVANKIGTYLKALAARANSVPFYVAAPSSSIDWSMPSGDKIPIEERSPDEVRFVNGLTEQGEIQRVLICPPLTNAINPGFDITPAKYITGIITERGVCKADEASLLEMFPEMRKVVQK
jgi:methylthioribose-1-phosphate isomerase